MDWEKLAREAQQVEEQREREKKTTEATVQPRAGDTMLHSVFGRCVFAGYKGNDRIFVRKPDGRVVILSLSRIEITPSQNSARTFIINVKSA